MQLLSGGLPTGLLLGSLVLVPGSAEYPDGPGEGEQAAIAAGGDRQRTADFRQCRLPRTSLGRIGGSTPHTPSRGISGEPLGSYPARVLRMRTGQATVHNANPALTPAAAYPGPPGAAAGSQLAPAPRKRREQEKSSQHCGEQGGHRVARARAIRRSDIGWWAVRLGALPPHAESVLVR